MTPPVRLIATDLDGTLLGSDDRISERTLAALAAARLAGVHVVAATGRSHRTAVPLIGPSGPHRRRDLLQRRHGLRRRRRPRGGAAPRHGRGRRRHVRGHRGAGARCELRLGVGRRVRLEPPGSSTPSPRWVPPSRPWPARPVQPAAGLALLKVFVAHPEITHDALLAAVAAALPPGLTVTHSGARSVEVTAEGVDKAAALARVCARFGIGADEVVAFGDNQNDLEMLRWAGPWRGHGQRPPGGARRVLRAGGPPRRRRGGHRHRAAARRGARSPELMRPLTSPAMPLSDRILLGPGPSNPYPEVAQAFARPLLGHLDPEFLALLDDTCERLRQVFRTSNELTLRSAAPAPPAWRRRS